MKNENKAVEYDSMTKEELIGVIKSKDQAYENLKIVMDNNKENYDKDIKEIDKNYQKVISDLTRAIKYYKNKFNIIKNICDLEGGEK